MKVECPHCKYDLNKPYNLNAYIDWEDRIDTLPTKVKCPNCHKLFKAEVQIVTTKEID